MTAVQQELPLPPSAQYVVEVNECGIFASTTGVDFWTQHILMRPIGDRIRWQFMSPGGGIAHIPCTGKEEAEFLHGQLVAHGIHKGHAKVKRLKAADRAYGGVDQ